MSNSETRVRWFNDVGEPIYQVTGSKGRPVNVTITHARKLGLFPGVTSILGLMASWSLQDWLTANIINSCILSPFTGDKENKEQVEEYVAYIHAKANEYADRRADRGSALHSMVNEYFDLGKYPEDAIAARIVDKIKEECEQRGITNVHGGKRFVSRELGYAGEPDLTGDFSDSVCIMDLKTTTLEKFSNPYSKWILQLGAYLAFKSDTGKNPLLVQVVADQDTGDTLFIENKNPIEAYNAFQQLKEVFFWERKFDPRKFQKTEQ